MRITSRYTTPEGFLADYMKNLGRGGCRLEAGRPIEVGTEFEFVLSLPETDAPTVLKGKVIEREEYDLKGGRIFSQQIRFLPSQEEVFERLEALARRYEEAFRRSAAPARRRVLLYDPDSRRAEETGRALEADGFHVVRAPREEAVLKCLGSDPPEVALLGLGTGDPAESARIGLLISSIRRTPLFVQPAILLYGSIAREPLEVLASAAGADGAESVSSDRTVLARGVRRLLEDRDRAADRAQGSPPAR